MASPNVTTAPVQAKMTMSLSWRFPSFNDWGKDPHVVILLCDVLDKLVVNYRVMFDVSFSGKAGPTVPAIEAYCWPGTGQSTKKWYTNFESLVSVDILLEYGNFCGISEKHPVFVRWPWESSEWDTGWARKRILGELGSIINATWCTSLIRVLKKIICLIS